LVDIRIPGQRVPRLFDARDLKLWVGYKAVVEVDGSEYIGQVTSVPRRREPHTKPLRVVRIATEEDFRLERELREYGREIRKEAQKLVRDYQIRGVEFIGCDVSLDRSHAEVKYAAESRVDLSQIIRRLRETFNLRVTLKQFSFIERSGCASGCDTCGLPLCCSIWSGCRSQPVGVRHAKQQGITPSDKIYGVCGEVKCCMRYEHEVYKEFKERAPFKNSTVTYQGQEGQVVDYAVVQDAVFVQFGEKRSDRQLIPLDRLARENPGVQPADREDREEPEGE
jgi:cell fate regulator YaaT (PSP1 superfamily)